MKIHLICIGDNAFLSIIVVIMDITDFETTAKVLVGIAVLVNLSELVHPQCIGFGSSIDVREMYLHEHSESAIAFKVIHDLSNFSYRESLCSTVTILYRVT